MQDPPYCDSFAQSLAHLPLQFQSLFDSEHLKLNYLELVETAEKMTGLLDVTDQQCKHLEELTYFKNLNALSLWKNNSILPI